VLDAFQKMLDEFSGADMLQRRALFTNVRRQFSELTATSASRGAGQHYADKSIFYEECRRDLHKLRMGTKLAQTIAEAATLYCDLLLLCPRRRLAREQSVLSEWYDRRFSNRLHISLYEFLEAFLTSPDLEDAYRQIDRQMSLTRDTLERQLLDGVADVSVFELPREVVRGIVEREGIPLPAVCNADFLLIAESMSALDAERFQVLIGDCHAERETISHGSLGPFVQELFPEFSATVLANYEKLARQDETIVDLLIDHRNKTYSQISLSCADLEFLERSPKPRTHVISPYQIQVHRTVHGLRLYAPTLQSYIKLTSPLIGSVDGLRDPLTIFSFPQHYSGAAIQAPGLSHVPRLVVGQIILQRERWRVSARRFALEPGTFPTTQPRDEAASFLQALVVQKELGLPRQVFAKFPAEAKPVYIDFSAPLLVRQLLRLARHTPEDMIEFSEMLPGPQHLWLVGPNGHHTSELRLATFDFRSTLP
jgi:hypothetical protein